MTLPVIEVAQLADGSPRLRITLSEDEHNALTQLLSYCVELHRSRMPDTSPLMYAAPLIRSLYPDAATDGSARSVHFGRWISTR
ncbi:hypothetical protein [Synechococcus sp. EJ6-Ellesmere]|uniref:hypothetical protein n=1 Tax=Synechococcus sp. EJ6-Ellesmere TaxID=2823734 RepID=UPI0020CC5EEA|nr:hypothetical protein [Synechococcus sp. EJ6-Ellesmere]MCP9824509.1 hypothetical protein [Synechococcus sp. EJ6-Ellesmere]